MARVTRAVISGLSGLVFSAAMFLQLSTFATGSVRLAWNPVPDPGVAGYNIHYGGASNAYTNESNVGRATNAFIAGLVEGATYYFAATTYSTTGLESPFSNEVSYKVPVLVALSLQIIKSNGLPVSLSISTTGLISGPWTLQFSPDMKTWTMVAHGTNQAVKILVPINSLPMQFFRLRGQ